MKTATDRIRDLNESTPGTLGEKAFSHRPGTPAYCVPTVEDPGQLPANKLTMTTAPKHRTEPPSQRWAHWTPPANTAKPGANAPPQSVAFGTSAIIAGGCIACMQCHIGQCVTGIATQDPEHESRYDPEAESHNIHRFLEGVRWQIAALTHALGYSDFRALNRDDLVALTPEAAEITGLPFEPGVRAKAPELRVQLG